SLLPLRRRGSAQIGDRSARKSVKARRPLRRERFVEFPEVSRLHADACASRRHRRPAHATPERPSARRSSPSSQAEAVSHETGGTPIIPDELLRHAPFLTGTSAQPKQVLII